MCTGLMIFQKLELLKMKEREKEKRESRSNQHKEHVSMSRQRGCIAQSMLESLEVESFVALLEL